MWGIEIDNNGHLVAYWPWLPDDDEEDDEEDED